MAFDNAEFSKPQREVKEEELKAFISVPGVVCNRFYMAAQDMALIRIVFADEAPDPKNPDPLSKPFSTRYGVVMSINSFMSFAQMVQNTANAVMQNIMKQQSMAAIGAQAIPQQASDPNKEKLD